MKKDFAVQSPGEALPIDIDLSMLHPAPICFSDVKTSTDFVFPHLVNCCVNYDPVTDSACQPFEHCSACMGWNGEEF